MILLHRKTKFKGQLENPFIPYTSYTMRGTQSSLEKTKWDRELAVLMVPHGHIVENLLGGIT